jgi:oligopeptide transport system ATP-binding protein
MNQPGDLLAVHELRTSFFTRAGVVKAVDGVSFHVAAGEALGLVGESGCGKSVTALSIMGLVAPPGRVLSGRIEFEGRDLVAMREAERQRIRGDRIAMVFQDPISYLNPVQTIGRQVAEPLRLHRGTGERAGRARAIELLELVGIPNPSSRVDAFPHQFSGGMRQRAMIAMALACEPSLLIADEPTTALDVTIQAQILDLLQRLRRELGMALLLITHDLGVVAGIVDRVNVMYAGRVVETAGVERAFGDPRHPYTEGLMRSIPRIDRPIRGRLEAIPGVPPDLVTSPPGCSFAPRCRYAVDRCASDAPTLELVAPDHRAACWVDVPAARRLAS